MDAETLNRSLVEASANLDQSLRELEDAANKFADSERTYRKAKSVAFIRSSGTNAQEREANAELQDLDGTYLSDIRYARDLAEGLKQSALEAVRSHRAQLSAIQTIANLYREEAAFDRTGAA
jgi:hypothetical protein